MPDRSNIPATVAEFRALRAATGLGAFSQQATQTALANTLHAVWFRHNGALVGMGRLIGDGACFAQVTDIAVHPDYQRQGLGQKIMTELMLWVDQNLSGCYISLIADPGAERLYAGFGFTPRNGMARNVP